MIEISHLSKTFVGGQMAALSNVNITMEHGSFFTLLGPSGCGKTTLLRCIAGLETPDEGEIRIDGKVVFSRSANVDVPINQRKIGMVFQSYAIWPHMSVFENVAFPLRAQGLSDIDARVSTALAAVHLAEMAQRPATRLSGGQQQRVALARAIVAEPSVLLLDEPLSNLDASLREQMRTEMGVLQQRLGLTTVLVTHDQEEALSLSDRIALLHAGKVIEQGTPHTLYHEPLSAFAAEFIGAANLIDGVVDETINGLTAVNCALGKLWTTASIKSGDVKLFVRPEKITVKSAEAQHSGQNVLMGQVRSRRFVGASTDADIVVDSGMVLRIRSSTDVPQGACMVVIDPADIKAIGLVD